MHMGDISKGVIPAIAIVGGNLPLAAGAALAFKMCQEKRVSVSFNYRLMYGNMKNGQCPKCGSSEIYHKLNGLAGSSSVAVRVSWISSLWLDIYVCTDCGYVESYVESYAVDKGKLSKLREKWDRVA